MKLTRAVTHIRLCAVNDAKVAALDALAAEYVALCQQYVTLFCTEAEGEKAARGTDGRIYPRGDGWDAARANTKVGGPLQTTPVGSYPEGVSPYGALDMAGNLWKWTGSVFTPYPYVAGGGRERPDAEGFRVLRGGS
jgi:formylglycine-generating enzyme required for sulfatase activity